MIRRRRPGSGVSIQNDNRNEQEQPDAHAEFANSTLAPSITGTLTRLYARLLSFVIGYCLILLDRYDGMAIKIGGWIMGRQAQPGQAGQADGEGVPLVEREQEKGKEKKIKRRRRKEPGGDDAVDGYYPGMVNLSGVLCYMNSVLQSLASVTSVIHHLERITLLAVETDLPTPVTDALSDVLSELNTPSTSQPRPIRPHNLLSALAELDQIRRLLATREQQDAHELFVILAEAISNESLKVAKEVVRLRGMADVLSLQGYCVEKGAVGPVPASPIRSAGVVKQVKQVTRKVKGLAQPWEGLTARRRVCRRCGYHSEVRMETLGGMELPLPLSGVVSLEACIGEYLKPDLLSEVTCEMCSLRQTLDFYQSEHSRLQLPPSKSHLNGHNTPSTPSGSFSVLENLPHPDSSDKISDKRKKRAKEAKKVVTRLEQMVESGSVSHYGEAIPTIDSELPVKWQKVNCDSVRECLLTRPPPTLRLHLDRSGMTPYGQLVKKGAWVKFPLVLDMTRFISSGVWEDSTQDTTDINATPKRSTGSKVLYRLESAILHYGATTSSGHFTCIRRKPTNVGGRHAPMKVTKTHPDECGCVDCVVFGKVRGEGSVPGKGWLMVSDDEVEEIGEETLQQAGQAVFMLFYEKVGEYVPPESEQVRSGERGDDVKSKL